MSNAEEHWRLVSQWLHSLNLISPNHPCLDPMQGTLLDLVALLRDGRVLCQLAHKLDAESIDLRRVAHSKDHSNVDAFVCRNNIYLFLHAVVASFHLDVQQHFFEPEDLYNCRDLPKVIDTIIALSNTPKARLKQNGLTKSSDPKTTTNDHEDLDLEQGYGVAEREYMYDALNRRLNDESMYEDIYQTLFPSRPSSSRISLELPFSKKNRRAAPIRELCETEDKYLENLIMVRDVFRRNLTAINARESEIVFPRLDELIELHSDILFGLRRKRCDIGRVFTGHADRMRELYGFYCVHLPLAMNTLECLQQSSPPFRRQLLECQSHATPPTFPLSSHLVIPFQRFLKYHLLLKEILKHTAKDAPDFASLSLAAESIQQMNLEVNERKREQEELERQREIDEEDVRLIENVRQSIKMMRLPDNALMTDFGRLRKIGEITVYADQSKVADYVFLLDMIILLCQKPKWMQHRYRFKQALKVRDYRLETQSSSSDSLVFSFKLFCRSEPGPMMTFISKTQSDNDSWLAAMQQAMDAVSPQENHEQGHILRLTTFEETMECFQCLKPLRGSFFQGYRCLRCQAVLHKACVANFKCIEIGSIKRTNSVTLPTLDSIERADSTLSLTNEPSTTGRSRDLESMREQLQNEMDNLPLSDQPWYAGQLSGKIASQRLESLPVGTFMVRQRENGLYALMLKTNEQPKGVKAMVINESEHFKDQDEENRRFYFSGARFFPSIAKLVAFYRNQDLTENFDYPALKGVFLKIPYKNI